MTFPFYPGLKGSRKNLQIKKDCVNLRQQPPTDNSQLTTDNYFFSNSSILCSTSSEFHFSDMSGIFIISSMILAC